MINLLFISDIVGDDGLDLALDLLPMIRRDYSVDFVIANGENIRNGKGLSIQHARRMLDSGIDIITSGNHIWDGSFDPALFELSPQILRPLNYPDLNSGRGYCTLPVRENHSVTVVNVQGRSFMTPIDCPFNTLDRLLKEISNINSVIIVDMHAESTAEKMALGWFLDGRVSAVVGTHTHVQTADERILPKGTGYITDAGMTGPHNSVIGMDTETAIKRFRHQTPFFYKLAEGNLRFNGVIFRIRMKDKTTREIKRLNFNKTEYNGNRTNQRK
jgi:metallophosphoesterase (TIGR00282 family)